MKKILLITVLLIVTTLTKAQLTIACNDLNMYTWGNYTNKWLKTNEAVPTPSLFELNKEYTIITQTSQRFTSTYYIKTISFNDELKQLECDVISDDGNKYICIISKNNVRFVITENKIPKTCILFSIKKSWVPK